MLILTFEDMPATSQKPTSNWPYLITVVLMAAFGVIAILILTALRPTQDNSVLIATVTGFLGTITGVILTFLKAADTHDAVNSRLDRFLASAQQVAHFEGRDQGRQEGIIEGELRHPPVVQQPETPVTVPPKKDV